MSLVDQSSRFHFSGAIEPAQAIRLATAIFLECYPDRKRLDLIDRAYAAMDIIAKCRGAEAMQAVPRAIADDLAKAISAVAPDLIRLIPPTVPADVVRQGLTALEQVAGSLGYGPDETVNKLGGRAALEQTAGRIGRLQQALGDAKRRHAAFLADITATRATGAMAH